MLNMMRIRTNQTRLCIVVMGWLLALAGLPAAALAQKAAPMPNLQSTPHPLIGYAIIAFFAVVIVAISLLPSKRGHQD